MTEARFSAGKHQRKTDKPGTVAGSGLRIEPVNLPKGGGAITGLPQHFALNELSGTAQLNIPFEIPPGRGLAPDLTLTYGSGGGNGLFGIGFALNHPSIARKTSKAFPR